ncbi:MAG: response regulator [Candidatus Nitrosocosmicus sp.]
MKLLIAEDDDDIALSYKKGLEIMNYDVLVVSNGEDCLRIYNEELHKIKFNTCSDPNWYYSLANNPPFDIVLLDYKMPYIDGIEVAKEILSINPHQRIIFASAYVKETLEESIKNLNHTVELMQKPFTLHELIKVLEDEKIYLELERLDIDTDIIKAISPSHEQVIELLEKVKQVKKQDQCK